MEEIIPKNSCNLRAFDDTQTGKVLDMNTSDKWHTFLFFSVLCLNSLGLGQLVLVAKDVVPQGLHEVLLGISIKLVFPT